jgi:DNA polymerase III subunit alpha
MWVIAQSWEDGSQLITDDDGQRALVTTLEVPAHVLFQALPQGAHLIICEEVLGGGSAWGYWACSVEEFMERRTEDIPRRVYLAPKLHHFEHIPTYREFYATVKGEEAARPRDHFVNLHTHTDFSSLDGLTKMDELAERLVELGQEHMAVTDHGTCAGHYHLMKQAKAHSLHPIFGIEGYFVDDRRVKEDQYDYRHIILLAQSSRGLHNLWALSTDANRPDAFYGKPRMDWELLSKYADGLICTTACLRGPLASPMRVGNHPKVTANLGRLLEIFGERLYIELGSSTTEDQVLVNKGLVELAHSYSVPLIAAVDSHYPHPDDYEAHQVWVRAGTNTTGTDTEQKLFGDQMPYHLATSAEVAARLSYLPDQVVIEALDTTVELAESCVAEFPAKAEMPMFNPEKGRVYAIERCCDVIEANWQKKCQGKPIPEAVYLERVNMEMDMLVPKNFIDNFMITADYVRAAKEKGILVGPGRGSAAGSLVAYLLGITEVDPLEHDLPFSRFMTPGRIEPPDFDVDFPTSARPWAQHFVTERWGADHVARVGTHGRLKNKQVVRDVSRVFNNSDNEADKIDYKDIDLICGIIDAEEATSAGLGYSWAQVMAANEEVLAPYVAKYPRLFTMCERLVGRLKSYGRHAAGLVISTIEPLDGRLPLRVGDEDQMVSEFDYESSEAMGLLKFDFLTLRTLDTLDLAVKTIEANYGTKVSFYDWHQEYDDPLIWTEMANGNTLGVFQFETRAMTRLARQVKPENIAQMSDIQSLVRPGPMRSGITSTYILRKDGAEAVTYADPRLEPVLEATYGAIIYQEQLMTVCRVLAGYDDVQADYVRKILGKKKKELVDEEGKKFVAAAAERGMAVEAAQALWERMGIYAMYVFNKSHAVSYSLLSYWTAWLKVHYPAEFLTAVLATVDKDSVPKFAAEARRFGYQVLPPDVNLSSETFTTEGTAIRYGLGNLKGVGEKAVEVIMANRPYSSFDDFAQKMAAIPRKPCNAGAIKVLAAVGAFDTLVPSRRALESQLAQERAREDQVCIDHNPDQSNHGLPCNYDWDNEPVELNKRGKPIAKTIPKKCWKACRHYRPRGVTLPTEPYTRTEVMEREMEHLGFWITYTPFDIIDKKERDQLYVAEEIETGVDGPFYNTALLITNIRKTKVKATGETMAIITGTAFTSEIDVAVFPRAWATYSGVLKVNQLVLLEVRKNDKGLSSAVIVPV